MGRPTADTGDTSGALATTPLRSINTAPGGNDGNGTSDTELRVKDSGPSLKGAVGTTAVEGSGTRSVDEDGNGGDPNGKPCF